MFHKKLQFFPLFRAQRVQPQGMCTDLWTAGSDWVFSLTALITTTSTTTPTLWPWPTMALKTLTIRYSLRNEKLKSDILFNLLQNDGSTQQLAGCLRDFRNKPFPVSHEWLSVNPSLILIFTFCKVRAKIEYFKNTLTVLFHNGMSNNEKDFEMCIRAENVVLPKNGYFGVSAATGGLADDHDVLKLVTHSLRSPEMALTPDHVDQEVRILNLQTWKGDIFPTLGKS